MRSAPAAQTRPGTERSGTTVSIGASPRPSARRRHSLPPSSLAMTAPSITASRISFGWVATASAVISERLRQRVRDPVVALSAVVAREQAAPARTGRVRPGAAPLATARAGAAPSRRVGAGPLAVLEAEHAARRRAERASPVRREGKREHGADDLALAFGRPAAPTAARSQQAEVGAHQQMRRIARIDRHREGRVQEQPDVSVEPGAAEVAGTKHPAIGAGVVRAGAGACQHRGERQRLDDRTGTRRQFSRSQQDGEEPAPDSSPLNTSNKSLRSGLARRLAGSQRDLGHARAVRAPPRRSWSADTRPCRTRARGRRRSSRSRR